MTTPTRRFLRRHAKVLFKPAARYPMDPRAVFMLAFSVFVGLTALAIDAAPQTLNSLLPHWAVLLWGGLLTAGSAITLVGMAKQNVNGILIEQVGSVMVAVTTIYYAVLATLVVGVDAIQSVGIVAAWGLSCLARWIQLQALIADGQAKALERQVERAVIERIDQAVSDSHE